MLKLVDKKNKKEKGQHVDSIDELIKSAKNDAKNQDLVHYRRRVGFNSYVIEVWSSNPIKKGNKPAEHLYDIEGVTRTSLGKSIKLAHGKPVEHPVKKPKPKDHKEPS